MLTKEEFEELKQRKEWHGHNLGYRDLENYRVVSLLDLLIADYEQLLELQRHSKS